MRLREVEDQFIETLQGIPDHQYLGILLGCCLELREIYSEMTDEETEVLLDRSIQLITAAYLESQAFTEIGEILERWTVRNSRDDGSSGYLNLRFVFEDIIGELAGERPARLWLDRISYPFIFAPRSTLIGLPVVQVSNLELQDSTREALLMRSLVMLSERIRSRPEHIALADLDQIRREVFEGA